MISSQTAVVVKRAMTYSVILPDVIAPRSQLAWCWPILHDEGANTRWLESRCAFHALTTGGSGRRSFTGLSGGPPRPPFPRTKESRGVTCHGASLRLRGPRFGSFSKRREESSRGRLGDRIGRQPGARAQADASARWGTLSVSLGKAHYTWWQIPAHGIYLPMIFIG